MLQIASKRAMLGFLVLNCLTFVRLWAATAPVAVQGTVLDDNGKPVRSARVLIASALPVTATHFAAPPVLTGPLVTAVTADSRGDFSVPTLPAGQYIACAEATTPGLLDPCHWAASAPTFTVASGQTTPAVNITMATGAIVRIHVDDPQALLKAVSGPIDFDLQIHVVTSKGFHYNAAVQTSGPLARDHAVTVPFDAPVSIRVLSPHLVVNDQSGNPVSPNGASITAASGVSPSTISFVVAGKK